MGGLLSVLVHHSCVVRINAMRMSRDHILTSQAGSLPRPDDLIEANRAREAGETTDERRSRTTLQAAVVDVVRRQKEIGIDVPGDGEFGKAMGHKVNYRAWWSYCFNRLGGLDLSRARPVRSRAETSQPRRSRADQLRRPARPHQVPAGLHRMR